MKIVIGLGNPGEQYARTKHNMGFDVIDECSLKYGCSVKNKGFSGIYGITRLESEELMLFKPLTYMNLSGEAVQAVFKSKAKEISDILVIVDDLSIPLGTLRLRRQGSSGGHNGLKSIIEKMGNEFARLKIGIGKENMPDEKSGYVLSVFGKEDREKLNDVILKAVECVRVWAISGVDEAMRYANK
ncbi:peptidyl-tRNA hydrolase [Candidatus Omnitrophus magneticus]|uniref:Peptidyl-tRNA hydrolase n=1 Tax=Candidatus Omnitrophus magneticus TaxID=1609969 RepID=A0A0F0CP07_9BACT|nr:peptidyl-tRNA hydrolase [Candidatus Omnitrophus magneticus]